MAAKSEKTDTAIQAPDTESGEALKDVSEIRVLLPYNDDVKTLDDLLPLDVQDKSWTPNIFH
jgi:hypothetical protein